jgi:hypothetical protein
VFFVDRNSENSVDDEDQTEKMFEKAIQTFPSIVDALISVSRSCWR